MATKNSQKTEDMLDQTFANFDNEVTGAQNQQFQDKEHNNNVTEKKKSSNMPIYIGAGVAAVGIASYLFVIKPMLNSNSTSIESQQVKVTVQTTGETQQVTASLTPEVPETPPQGIPDAQITNQEQSAMQIQVTSDGIQTPEVSITSSGISTPDVSITSNNTLTPEVLIGQSKNAETINLNTNNNTQSIVSINQSKNVETKNPNTKTTDNNNAQSIAIISELKNMFEQQTNEFKSALTNVDGRITNLENSVSKIEQHLETLENERPKISAPHASKAKKATVKHKIKKNANKKQVTKEETYSIIVDKRNSDAKDERLEESNLSSVKIHSIYNGRLWIKNDDNTLSTYTVGEKLPTGEVIKSIDDVNLKITTNKRVIKNDF